MKINEKCKCGATLVGEAEGQVELGFLRVRHHNWVAEHKSCVAISKKKEPVPQTIILNRERVEEMMQVPEFMAAIVDGLVHVLALNPGSIPNLAQTWKAQTTASTTGNVAFPVTGREAKAQREEAAKRSGATRLGSTSTSPPKISPRTQEEMDALIGAANQPRGLVRAYQEQAWRDVLASEAMFAAARQEERERAETKEAREYRRKQAAEAHKAWVELQAEQAKKRRRKGGK